jgi:predicted TPR repeat methyltransferase
MKPFIEKLRALERQMAHEKGAFALFALFQREEAQNRWDLVAAADWFAENKKDALNYLAAKIKACLDEHELLAISRIVLLDRDDPHLDAIQRAVQVEHGLVKVSEARFFDMDVRQAYIITSARHDVASAARK